MALRRLRGQRLWCMSSQHVLTHQFAILITILVFEAELAPEGVPAATLCKTFSSAGSWTTWVFFSILLLSFGSIAYPSCFSVAHISEPGIITRIRDVCNFGKYRTSMLAFNSSAFSKVADVSDSCYNPRFTVRGVPRRSTWSHRKPEWSSKCFTRQVVVYATVVALLKVLQISVSSEWLEQV